MVVKGVYVKDGKAELYPDIGYSFCNCKDVFYTNHENVKEPVTLIPEGDEIIIHQPDPFFVEWGNNPYTFVYWNPRKYQILWDMHSLVQELPNLGYEVLEFYREFAVDSKLPQHFYIKARRK